MSLPLATVTTEFLDRPDLASSTVRSYELALLPLLRDYGSWPIELVDRSCLEAYLKWPDTFGLHHPSASSNDGAGAVQLCG